MRRKIIVGMLAIVLLAGLAACQRAEAAGRQYGATDKAVDATAGQEFTIVLDSNRTTGYEWQLTQPLDEAKLKLVKSEYVEPTASGKVGVGGQQVFTFKAVAAGKSTIALQYVRPWEKPLQPVQSLTFDVTVR